MTRPAPDAQTLFKRHFGYPPAHSVRAPSSFELLGTSAVDSQGLAISAAVDQYAHVASAPRSDGKIELICCLPTERDLFWMSELAPAQKEPWSDCVRAVLQELRRRGVHFSGFNAAIAADWDNGFDIAEPGTFAALQVATALTIRRLHPYRVTETGATVPPRRNARGELPPLDALEKVAVAQLCFAAGEKQLGSGAGLLHPLTSLFGKAWHLLSIDLQSATVEKLPFIGEVFVACQRASQAPEGKPPQAQSEVHACVDAAARKLGAKSLRLVEMKSLEKHRDKLDLREYECARYYLSEAQRIVAAERALRSDDHAQFGQYCIDSSKSARELLRTTTPDVDVVNEIAARHSGCFGLSARGSHALCLVNFHQAEPCLKHIGVEFKRQTGRELKPALMHAADGAEA